MPSVHDAMPSSSDNHAEIVRRAFLREPCGICGQIAEIAPPGRWWWRHDAHAGEAGFGFFPDKEPLCIRCTLEHCPDAHRSVQTRVIEDVTQRKGLIGLGDDVTLYVTTSHPTGGSDWLNGIRLIQYVAFYRGEVPDGSKVPGLWFREPGGLAPFDRPFGMLWFGWDTATEDLRTVARFTWSVNDWSREGSLTIDGWSQSSAATITRLLHASEDFMHKTRGRPKDVTDRTLMDYQRAFRLVADRKTRRPKLAEVAAEVMQDRGTVSDNLQRWGFHDYRHFAAEMMANS